MGEKRTKTKNIDQGKRGTGVGMGRVSEWTVVLNGVRVMLTQLVIFEQSQKR